MSLYEIDPRLRFVGIWPARVVANDDPEKLHRVRFMVPGLVEPSSPWAMPAGLVADHEDGLWSVPEVGMNVWAAFAAGDPKRPLWFPGPWGQGDQPQDDVRKRGVRWDDFQLLVDETLHRATLEDRTTGIVVELDRATGKLSLHGPAGLNITSTGIIRISGTGCEIQGRPVVSGAGPI